MNSVDQDQSQDSPNMFLFILSLIHDLERNTTSDQLNFLNTFV